MAAAADVNTVPLSIITLFFIEFYDIASIILQIFNLSN
jgi:hypothetical protein